MLRFLADENFDGNIVRGLIRRSPHLEIVRVQDVGLSGQHDEAILAWAAEQDRILLTHDIATIPGHAADRIRNGLHMPGVVAVSSQSPIGQVIADLQLLAECSLPGEWNDQIVFVPLPGR